MTPKTQASQIVQKHYDIIESHLPIHSMTESQMMKMAKEHATEEVKGITNLHTLKTGKGFMLSGYSEDVNRWYSILDELENQ